MLFALFIALLCLGIGAIIFAEISQNPVGYLLAFFLFLAIGIFLFQEGITTDYAQVIHQGINNDLNQTRVQVDLNTPTIFTVQSDTTINILANLFTYGSFALFILFFFRSDQFGKNEVYKKYGLK